VTLHGKKAAVLLYSGWPSDSRPYRAALALMEAGMEVDVLCLTEQPGEPLRDKLGKISIYRLPFTHRRSHKAFYLKAYSLMFLASVRFLGRRRYDIVHVHNMPDFLAFAGLGAKLRGTPIILDLHDPMPELMMSIYGMRSGHWLVRLLRWLEKRSIGVADLVLTPNLSFRHLFVSRGCPPKKIEIIMNSPDEAEFNPERFGPDPATRPKTGEFRVMHHGAIVHRHGLDLLIEAAAKLRPKIPGLRIDIYGPSQPFLQVVLKKAEELKVADIVHYHGGKTAEEIARAILQTDVGVIPNRRSSFTEKNFPTRIFEYLAMGRTVVCPATQGITEYFQRDELPLYEQNNTDDLAAQLLWVYQERDAAQAMLKRGVAVYRRHLWSDEKARFVELVAALIEKRQPRFLAPLSSHV